MVQLNRRRAPYPPLPDEESGEEVDLNGGTPVGTTTVTMFDHDVSNSADEQAEENDQGEQKRRIRFLLLGRWTNVL